MAKPVELDRKILPDDLPRIIQLFREGNTQTDIGLEYGVDHSTIYYHLVKVGVICPVAGQRIWRRSLKRAPLLCVSLDVLKKNKIEPPAKKSYKEYLRANSIIEKAGLIRILTGKEKHSCAIIGHGGSNE